VNLEHPGILTFNALLNQAIHNQQKQHLIWFSSYSFVFRNNPLTPELNPWAQRCLRDFLLGILLLEPCISIIYE
jgi:hypothetical protein